MEDGLDNWMKVNKKLSNAINDVKGVSYTTNYILLTVNLNERSNRADLIKENETWKYKAESTLSTFNFINKLATLNNVLPDPIYFKNSERDKIGEIDDDDDTKCFNIIEPLYNIKYDYIDNYNSICQKLRYNDINVLYSSPFYERLMIKNIKEPNEWDIWNENETIFKINGWKNKKVVHESSYTEITYDSIIIK